jgi:predicted enzyme related to lactoylglutathione lyase
MEVLGFHLLRPAVTMSRAETPEGAIFKIYPKTLNKVTVVAMSSGAGLGVEIFQFHDPAITEATKANFETDYARGGFFHIGVTTPDVQVLCDKIVAAGGKLIGEKVSVYEYDAVYTQDPWGNVIELIEASFERVMSNR